MTLQATRKLCCEPQSHQAPAAPGFLDWLAKRLPGPRLHKRPAKLPIHDARAMADIGLGIDGCEGSVTRIPKEVLRQEMIALKLMGR